MTILSVANQGGSAGKTTTAVTLAALLAEQGITVRLLDFDGQGNATFSLGCNTPARTTGDVLLRRVLLQDSLWSTDLDNLAMLPSARSLDNDAVELGRTLGGEQRLRQALEATEPADVTIIDCPGSLNILTVTALVASDYVITVAAPTVKEIAGIPPLEDTIADVAGAYNPKLKLAAVVPCAVPPASAGTLYTDALQLLTDNYGDLVTPPVRRSVRVPEAYSQQLPLSVHAPSEGVTDDYRRVLTHLSDRGVV